MVKPLRADPAGPHRTPDAETVYAVRARSDSPIAATLLPSPGFRSARFSVFLVFCR
jgi:hypothetical protein